MKNELRKKSLNIRKTLDCEILSRKIINNLTSCSEYKNSKNIICYHPLKYEVNTLLCINDCPKNVYLPRVNGDKLEICSCENLSKGHFGIMEPKTEPVKDYSSFDIVLIPAVAADRNGYRIGYGKGYYDRFLPELPKNCKKIILVYSDLLYDNVFPEKHDIKSDIIVTDKAILRITCENKY